MCRSSLAHERQSIIQAARIAELEHELARLRASASAGAITGSSANGTGSAEAESSDVHAQAPTAQKGRWWGTGLAR